MMKTGQALELREHGAKEGDKLVMMSLRQGDMELHAHHFFELAYVTEGTALQNLNGTVGKVQKGDYFLLDYNSVHSYQDSRDFSLINCLFLPEIIDRTLAGCHTFEELLRVCLIRYYKQYYGRTPGNHVFHDEDGRILTLLLGMQEEYREQNTGYTEIFRCRLLEILIHTMRKIIKEDSLAHGNVQSTAVLQAIQYLEEHFAEKTVLGSFCQEHHYSLQYISRRFRQETGLTAREYLQKIRMERGCELLAGSDLQIQEVAHEVGYEDLKFFNQVFRRLLLMSPGEYRKMSRATRG